MVVFNNKIFSNLIMILCAVIYFFSVDIIAAMPPTNQLVEQGIINIGLRFPSIGGSLIMFILSIGSLFSLDQKYIFALGSVIAFATLLLMLFGHFPIGSSGNIFLLLWYGISCFTLVLIGVILLLFCFDSSKRKSY